MVGLLLVCFSIKAQRSTFLSRSELGVHLGQMYYLGDLNPSKQFYQSNLAGGLMYRFNWQTRMALRFNFTTGSVEAYDKDSNKPLLVNRNLDFQSKIHEIAGGVEFYHSQFQIGNKRYFGTFYFLTQIGLFYMNPTTSYNGEKIELNEIGTEGQGSSLNNRRKYNNLQLCIPIGLGGKVTLGKLATFNVDIAIRKTFTDYLDDVGSDSYLDPVSLASVNGSTAAALSNRSLDGNRFGKRGNSTTKDWYVYFGGMVTIKLGQGKGCPRPQ
ncbi:MAG: hypothetical protein FJZ67_08500 [Bacteroidetes bacterium]|nr:hypothetical protein [Bacteroidota bacterium]